jgi:hypothetical protein
MVVIIPVGCHPWNMIRNVFEEPDLTPRIWGSSRFRLFCQFISVVLCSLGLFYFAFFKQIVISLNYQRRVWRYQRGNQNPYIEEEQTTQWPTEKGQKDKQRSTKHTYKTKDRVTRTPTKNREWTQVLRKGKQFLLH